MKKKVKIISFLLLITILSSFFIYAKTNKEYIINKTFKTKYYSYLPQEAKDYIKKAYMETGEIIKTEKNSEENVPYLSPKYVKYLSLSDEEKDKVEEIPPIYNITFSNEQSTEELPKTYDLRNVNENNYLSALKNQSTLDLCWDFATVEQIESNIMLHNNQPYNNSSLKFSTRQIDYASSTDGIKDYDNKENGTRKLTTGGNFMASTLILYNGLGLYNENDMPFNTTKQKKELSEVLNDAKTLYELDSSIYMPSMKSNATEQEWKEYNDTLKQFIMQYGGAYVGTQAPGPEYNCSAKNTDGINVIKVDTTCEQNGNHAMQLIGWDDDYEYSYCNNGTKHEELTAACSNENIVTGKGAWLLRNSWGNNNSYVYLAYGSLEDDVYIFKDLTSSENKTWDNNYHKNISPFEVGLKRVVDQTFEKEIDGEEKIEKIKFFSYAKNGTYNLSITSGDDEYLNIKKVTVPYPGIYTIDLSEDNVYVNNSEFQVKLASTNNTPLIDGTISVFTSNVSKKPIIKNSTESINLEQSSSNYSFRLYSTTKNIPSNTNLNYFLADKEGNDESEYLIIKNNTVANNKINTLVEISSEIKKGYHTLKVNYEGQTEDIQLLVGNGKITVQYNSNNETNESINQTIDILSSTEIQNNTFTREGYTFKEWNTASDGTGEAYTPGQVIESSVDDIMLYAIWTPNTYTISFDANGGEGSMERQEFIYDAEQPLAENTFINQQYQFVSWNTKADGTGIFYQNTQNILNLTSKNNEQITLYAMWNKVPDIYYKTHVQNVGWQDYSNNGKVSGTEGRALRLEAIQIKLLNKSYDGSIEYKTHIQNIGWESTFKKNDEISGTSGKSLRLEGIEIKLTGELANHYDIYYQVHAENFGWLGWAKNGEDAGTAGYSYRLEAIRIRIVNKNEKFPEYGKVDSFKGKVQYQTHIQYEGWQNYKKDGEMSGTSGRSLRLEGIKIKTNINSYKGDIEYKTHIQNIGWEDKYHKNGEISGTSGKSLRLEGIIIRLTGEMSNYYDIYYRVHAENFGWLNWAKNDEKAGTEGYSYRLEGIEIVIVKKGQKPPIRMNTNNDKTFIKK